MIHTYVGETFISCVFVHGKQGNGRRGKNKKKCLVGPWAFVGRALMGQALMGRALMGPALMGRALMGRALMGQPLWGGPSQAPWANFPFFSPGSRSKAINVSSTYMYIYMYE